MTARVVYVIGSNLIAVVPNGSCQKRFGLRNPGERNFELFLKKSLAVGVLAVVQLHVAAQNVLDGGATLIGVTQVKQDEDRPVPQAERLELRRELSVMSVALFVAQMAVPE